MERLQTILRQIHAESVLDIATRYGDFARTLAENLGSYEKLIAIDCNPKALEEGKKRLADIPNVRFEQRDACRTGFADHAFSVVGMSNSLHHIADTEGLLQEMRRIVKPDGCVVIAEMTCDGQHGAGKTHALLHEWESDIDTACGVYHRHTYSREELSDMVRSSGMTVETAYATDAFNPNAVRGLEKRLTEDAMRLTLSKAIGKEAFPALREHMRKIQAYHAQNGVAFATVEVLVARP